MGGKCDFDSGSNSYTSFYTRSSSVDWIDTNGNGLAYAAFKLSTQEKKKRNKQKNKNVSSKSSDTSNKTGRRSPHH